MINYKKLCLVTLAFTLQASIHSLGLQNDTPEAMAVFAQVGKGTQAQTLAESIAPNSTTTVELIEMPRNLYVRDAQYSWTNVPQLDTSNYTYASLNNSTLKISPDGAYKKNAPWNIQLELISGSQLETKGKRAAAAASSEDVKREAAATTSARGDAKRSQAELAALEVKEREAAIASQAAAVASDEVVANIYNLAPDTAKIFKQLPNGTWLAAQNDSSMIQFDATGKTIIRLTDSEGNTTEIAKIV